MLGLGLACLLVMSSSDEDDTAAIQRAQAQARAAASRAPAPAATANVEVPVCMEAAESCAELSNCTVDGVSTGGPRKTCMKEKLAVMCPHCSNRPADREACAYKTGEWDPPCRNDAAAAVPAEQQTMSADMAEPVLPGECRSRKQTEFFEPDEHFWRRELPDIAMRRGVASASRSESVQLAAEMAELERTLVVRLQDAEQRAAILEAKERRRAEEKRQKTMLSFATQSRGLPTRAAHFDTDVSNAIGYLESELHRSFRRDIAAVEAFIENRVSDPLKQLQLADAVDRRFHGIRTSLAAENVAAKYVLESLQNFSATLYHRYNGRYPNDVRAAQQGAAAAIANKIPKGKLGVVSEATGFPVALLSAGRDRWQLWFNGSEDHLVDFRGQVRSDKMCPEWIDLAVDVWRIETRPDPSTKASIRNPHNHSDKTPYRIHYLEMRIGDMQKLIVTRGKEKFGDKFHFSWWYCIKVRPFWVKDAGRETSVCIYHMRFDLMVEALYVFIKKLRDAKVCSCTFPNVKDPAEFRRGLLCSYRGPFARPDCASGNCLSCAELQQFNSMLCPCFDFDDDNRLIRWEEYAEIKYKRKDNTELKKKDFVVVNTTFQVFIEHFGTKVWPKLRVHHQIAKLQSEDIRFVKTHVLRGNVCDVEDFSQNGSIKPKREHVSRYFSEVGYTLYGMILTGHLDDFKNISETEREELRNLLTEKRLPLSITESHIVISADLTHDGFAVMHFNDKILSPYIRENMIDIKRRIRISDGGPNHLKLADLALHTSKQKIEQGILLEHIYQATAHAKDLSDSECGGAKHAVEKLQMTAEDGETSKVSCLLASTAKHY